MTTSNLAVFSFNNSSIRTFQDDKNEAWFLANDVCDVLGYRNSRDAISKHCKETGIAKRETATKSDVAKRDTTSKARDTQEMTYINEPNLYRLIIKSRKPEAEAFESWVMEEVLPTIRKTGSYTLLITPSQQQQIKEAVNTKVIASKTTHQAVWRSIYNQFGVAKYQQLPAAQFDQVIQFLHGAATSAPVVKIDPMLGLQHQRFLVSFDHQNQQQVQLIPHNAYVMTVPELLKAVNEPNGCPLDDDLLIDFAMATMSRLHNRLGYYKSKRTA